MNQVFSKALQDNNLDLIKDFVKVISMSIRNEIEDFHVAYLSDEQMKELNPLIRAGIYNALFAIANYDRDQFSKIFFDFQASLIPNYWEDPKLNDEFQKSLLSLNNATPIVFHSKFLNEQYEIGNLLGNIKNRCIKIRESFDFINVE